MAYGTDLLREVYRHQSGELALRVQEMDMLRSATTVAACPCGLEGRTKVIEVRTWKDLIAVNGNPLRGWSLLGDQNAYMPVIKQDGRYHEA